MVLTEYMGLTAEQALIRGLRNIIGRFWGRSGINARRDDSTSEDEVEPVDDTGVD